MKLVLIPWSVPSHDPSHKTGANWPWSSVLTFPPDNNNWSWLAFLLALECSLSRDWSWLAVEWPRNALSHIPPLEIGADRPVSVPVALECSLSQDWSWLNLVALQCSPSHLPLSKPEADRLASGPVPWSVTVPLMSLELSDLVTLECSLSHSLSWDRNRLTMKLPWSVPLAFPLETLKWPWSDPLRRLVHSFHRTGFGLTSSQIFKECQLF